MRVWRSQRRARVRTLMRRQALRRPSATGENYAVKGRDATKALRGLRATDDAARLDMDMIEYR